MKKTDVAMIILIAISSILIAFFVTKSIFSTTDTEVEQVYTIDEITATVEPPNPDIFNSNAINPAVGVQITPSNP